ncbi:molybdate transport system ATP-binding protein [Sporosarcina luteola]|nr:molybdate transport system ATP-binding protein [Sporosarcina luteola]
MLDVQIQKELPHFDIDVEFKANKEIVVLFGPSGSGKTTILNCLAGLEQPDGGHIRLGNNLLFGEGYSMPPQKRKIGYLFQDYALFPHVSVEKNIWYGVPKKDRPKKEPIIQQLLDVLGIHHLVKKYPHQISGGEKQRVALARALATEPSLLLLDEPLSALDEETRWQCQDELLRLHQLWNSVPFLIVTHDRNEAEKLGDRILHLDKGKSIKEQNR